MRVCCWVHTALRRTACGRTQALRPEGLVAGAGASGRRPVLPSVLLCWGPQECGQYLFLQVKEEKWE